MTRISQHPILPQPDHPRSVRFRFNGVEMAGIEGEMVATTLFANGVKEFSIHRKGDAPQGIFCANGQCAQCTLIIDGFPLKSCVTPLRENMDIRTLVHLPELPADTTPLGETGTREMTCDVLVAGGGPSGLTATIELARLGFRVILVDDKDRLGGKLLLQTHKFFGSIEDCYAGTRGIDIAATLEEEVRAFDNVEVLTGAGIVGIYKDRRAGVFLDNRHYVLIGFEGLVISAGARERSLIFPGNDLPGVYGAGAFQTLVNRDLVQAADRVLIVGSGNVGLIAAYHALQAGIRVAGIVEILPRISGYKVHADKIRRMGVPIHLRHTVLTAEGDGRLERVTIAEVDDSFNPLLESARTYAVDTLLIAVGLTPVDEFSRVAENYGFKVVKAGDADEIAEASSAMFGGRIAGLRMARLLGRDVEVDPAWDAKAEILKSRPGPVRDKATVELGPDFRPVIHCTEEIPCNPCTSVCPSGSITLRPENGTIMDVPVFEGKCTGCTLCVTICPGLAITLARRTDDGRAEVILPHEFVPDFTTGDQVALMDQEGTFLENGQVIQVRHNRKTRTWLIKVAVSAETATRVAGIRVQDTAATEPLPEARFEYLPDNGIVCRCERVTIKELVDHIRTHRVTDVNQLKQIRAGMGACGGKTCHALLPRVFRQAGVDWERVTPGTPRPLSVEVPMYALINETTEEDAQ